jgi:hypothetical protein
MRDGRGAVPKARLWTKRVEVGLVVVRIVVMLVIALVATLSDFF